MSQEKRHDPTPHRLQEARRRGEIHMPREWIGAVVGVTGLWGLALGADQMTGFWRELWFLSPEVVPYVGTELWRRLSPLLAAVVGGVGGLALVLGIVARLTFTRTLVSPAALRFQWQRLAPSGAVQRFQDPLTWWGVGRFALLLGWCGWLGWSQLWRREPVLVSVSADGLAAWWRHDFTARLVLPFLGGVVALAVADTGIQWLLARRRLRMSDQELKEEQRLLEGNPEVRARRRKLRFQMASRRMAAEVAQATLVVRNPQHYAVALRYEPERDAAPVVVAKGLDHLALRIVALAAQHGVPVVTQPPLARALYRSVELGEAIGDEFYEAVALILLRLQTIRRRLLERGGR